MSSDRYRNYILYIDIRNPMKPLSRRTLIKSSLLLAGNLLAVATPSDDSPKFNFVRLPFAHFEATLDFSLDPPVAEWHLQTPGFP